MSRRGGSGTMSGCAARTKFTNDGSGGAGSRSPTAVETIAPSSWAGATGASAGGRAIETVSRRQQSTAATVAGRALVSPAAGAASAGQHGSAETAPVSWQRNQLARPPEALISISGKSAASANSRRLPSSCISISGCEERSRVSRAGPEKAAGERISRKSCWGPAEFAETRVDR